MKKITVILLVALVLAACGGSKTDQSRKVDTFELALVTDLGTIDDKSFNQGAWEGLFMYARENNINSKYYQPAEKSDDAYLSAIDLAVQGGAKIIVTPGYLFATPIFIAQDRYPDVHFILVDAEPNDGDWSSGFPVHRTAKNTVGILYAEDQAGFLAGYAAVMDGNRSLGFMGGMAVPAVVRFGYGFVQGAEHAAQKLGLSAGSVTVNYYYTGGFEATPEIQTMSASWYNSGVEVIFACGGAVGNSVMSAAEQTGKKVIGVDVDQSGESPTVITSAMKGLRPSVYSCIADYYYDSFPGGETLVFDASNEGVGLPMETSKFDNFTEMQYAEVFFELQMGYVPRMDNLEESGSPSVVPVRITRVNEIK